MAPEIAFRRHPTAAPLKLYGEGYTATIKIGPFRRHPTAAPLKPVASDDAPAVSPPSAVIRRRPH